MFWNTSKYLEFDWKLFPRVVSSILRLGISIKNVRKIIIALIKLTCFEMSDIHDETSFPVCFAQLRGHCACHRWQTRMWRITAGWFSTRKWNFINRPRERSRFRFRCRVNYEFIRSLRACLPIHRAIPNGNVDRLFFPDWMFGSVIGSMTLNDRLICWISPVLQLTPFRTLSPSTWLSIFPRSIWKSRNALTDSINFRWPRKCPADSSPSTAWPVLL